MLRTLFLWIASSQSSRCFVDYQGIESYFTVSEVSEQCLWSFARPVAAYAIFVLTTLERRAATSECITGAPRGDRHHARPFRRDSPGCA
jgi:hypothetical protein